MSDKNVQRLPAEELFQRELDALITAETDPIPTGWRMSPRSVLAYIQGNTRVKGVDITPKYMGNRRLVEIAIATLVTDRALLLIGEPGTAKSWLSEHLAAALQGAVVKDEDKDTVSWKEYLENVMKKRGSAWLPLYRACRELNGK